MLFVFSLAAIIGVTLGLFGGGGGILTVPLLHYGLALSLNEAIVTSLLILSITSTISTLQYARWQQVHWRHGLLLGGSGMLGASIGTLGSPWLPDSLLLMLLATIMLASAIAMLCQRRRLLNCEQADAGDVSLPSILLTGMLIGVITGLVGAGGGFLVVPALLLLFNMPMRQAVGTSLFVIALNSSFGALSHFTMQLPPLSLLIPICLLATLGALLGSYLSNILSVSLLHKAFALFIMLLAIAVSVKEMPHLLAASWYLEHRLWWHLAAVITLIGLVFFMTRSCLSSTWRLPLFNQSTK